jgi:hypothetical protein
MTVLRHLLSVFSGNDPAYSPAIGGLVALSAVFVWLLMRWLRQSHVPGPLLSAISNVPRLSWAWSGRAHNVYMKLHEQHGDLVRVGPNAISVGDPKALSKIYGIGANFGKVRLFCFPPTTFLFIKVLRKRLIMILISSVRLL